MRNLKMTTKKINSHISSLFHNLVNNILSSNQIKVIKQDIDLIKLKNNSISSIIELKTSTWSHSKWKPFIKPNFPYWAQNRLDDPNYYALAKLCELLQVDLELYKTDTNSLKNGIKRYKIKIPYNNISSDFQLIDESISLNEFISEHFNKSLSNTFLSKRKPIKSVKDSSNPNISFENSLYSTFYNNKTLKNHYYVEREGVWTILISNIHDYNPKWIYIELDNFFTRDDLSININDWVDEFFPSIEIHKILSIPLSIISVTTTDNNINSIEVYDYINGKFSLNKNVNFFNFEKYYCKMTYEVSTVNQYKDV